MNYAHLIRISGADALCYVRQLKIVHILSKNVCGIKFDSVRNISYSLYYRLLAKFASEILTPKSII